MLPSKINKIFIEPLLGTQAARKMHKIEQPKASNVKAAADIISHTIETNELFKQEKIAPIFILSAGWRSGSTLVQRMLTSGTGVLMWGEPFDRSCIIQNITNVFLPLSANWPPSEYFYDPKKQDDHGKMWIANLYPTIENLIKSTRAFSDKLFEPPGNTISNRWGIKEVRWGFEEATILSALYPTAKFILLSRNLFDCYSSYKTMSKFRNWYFNWPRERAFTPFEFALHHTRLLTDFQALSNNKRFISVDYDSLKSQMTQRSLALHCDVEIDPSVIQHKVSGTVKENKEKLLKSEKLLLLAGKKLSIMQRAKFYD